MPIGKKLLGSFLVVIALTLLMFGVSSWGTSKIRKAHETTLASMRSATNAEQQSGQLSNLLAQIEAVHQTLQGGMSRARADMLQNREKIQLFNNQEREVLSVFVKAGTAELGALVAPHEELVVGTEKNMAHVNQIAAQLEQLWLPRHDGLAEDLSSLKRSLLNWTLKIANMMFVQSSIDELLYEDLADSPVEQFKAGKSYQKYAADFPELKQAMDKVSLANKQLSDLANELDMLTLFGKWEKARLFYRDHFPPKIKAVMVDLDHVIALENRILATQKEAISLFNNDLETAVAKMVVPFIAVKEELEQRQKATGLIVADAAEKVLSSSQATEIQIDHINQISIFITIVAVLVSLAMAFLVTRGITQPLKQANQMLADLEEGGLDTRLALTRQDELGMLGKSLDSFADNLQHEVISAFKHLAAGDFTFVAQGLVREPLAETNAALNRFMGEIRALGVQVANRSQQISKSSQFLSHGATEQASALVQVGSTLANVIDQSRQNSENAQHAHTLTRSAQSSAHAGSEEMQQVVQAMNQINAASKEIARIMKVIDEIAFQTNLLALNAAVEAARAGQHGKGFAVVAEEVRALANRSGEAASEIATLIEGSQQKVEFGVKVANSAAATLEGIDAGVSKIENLAEKIAQASRQQTQRIEEVNLGLDQIDRATQQTTVNSEASAAAAEDLARQASQLHGMLETFRLEKSEILHLNSKILPIKSGPQLVA